jgi:sugar/nucleoside kinase (ribokinase family)
MYDVYLYGMIAASTIYVIDDAFEYPQPNQYADIKQTLPSIGGEAINSAIILAKCGLKIKFDGCWIAGRNENKVRDLLMPFDIDLSRLTIKQDGCAEEFVITDKNSRTVFGNYAKFHSGQKQWNAPQEEDIQNARMVGLDPYFKDDALLAAKLCVKNNKPYVTLDCRYDDYIAQHAAAVVISHELRDQAYRDRDVQDVFDNYLTHCIGLVVFTFGSDALWYARKGQEIKKNTPYRITPVDTTGAGDSFRGAIIYGLLNAWNDETTIDFASAVAACVCLSAPHTLNAPELNGVQLFMKNYSQSRNKTI